MKTDFRVDLNFLRAVAVLSVVIFHFNVELFAGGFVGVDIFFVISGFLMTKIIVNGLNNHSFSFTHFYLARARRIIPALGVLCLTLMILGWFFLLPTEYRLLGKHTAASITFLSNYIYMGEAGYFDAASHKKWLLHTWSLSVEWQFYIIYPVLLALIHKCIGLKRMKQVVVFITVCSFIYMLYLVAVNDKSLYFGLTSRAWQMLAGGLVFLYPWQIEKRNQTLLFYAGLAMILTSLFFLDKSFVWPSALALVPILGTVMVLYANYKEGALLNNSVIAFIGLISYSVYLWHWPVVVAFGFLSIDYSAINVVGGISLSLALGYLSYRFVESIFGAYRAPLVKSYALYCVIVSLLFLTAVCIFIKDGFPIEQRFTSNVLHADAQSQNREPRKQECLQTDSATLIYCIYGNNPDKDKISAILFGDSHASSVINAFVDSLDNSGNILFIAKAGCMSVSGVYRKGKNSRDCAEFVESALQFLEKDYRGIPIILVNRWAYYLHGKVGSNEPLINLVGTTLTQNNVELEFGQHIKRFTCSLTEDNSVFIVKSIPEFSFEIPAKVARDLSNGKNGAVSIPLALHRQRNSIVDKVLDAASLKCGATLLEPQNYLCSDGYCKGSSDGIPLYYDDNHLSEYGNKLLMPMFKRIL